MVWWPISSFAGRCTYSSGSLGSTTADGIAAGTIPEPAALVASSGPWGWLVLALVAVLGLLGSLDVTWRIARVSFADTPRDGAKTAAPFLLAVLGLGAVAVLTVYTWLISGAGG